MRPNVKDNVQNRQFKQETVHNKKSKFREFQVGQHVMVRNYREGNPWVVGKVKRRLGRLLYQVAVNEVEWRRHADQITELETVKESDSVEELIVHTRNDVIQEEPANEYREEAVESRNERRYPDRIRRPPDRYS